MARRRANNEGTIIHRTDGRRSPWEVRFLVDGRRRVWCFATDAEAKAKLRQLQRDAELGLGVTESRQTVAHYLADWLEQKRTEREPGTWNAYEVDCRLHIVPIVGKVQLSKLTPQQVQRVVTVALDRGLSSTTAHGAFSTLRNALNDAYRLGLIVANPCGRAKAPTKTRAETHVYDAEQVAQLREAVRGNRLEVFYVLALATGARRGELLGLRWRDVDLTCGAITINMQLQRVRRAEVADDGATTELVSKRVKTARSRRQIPIDARTVDVLRDHRKRQLAERLAAGDRWSDRDLVLCTRYGSPVTVSSLMRNYARTIERAGLPYIRPHDLRHTAATLLLKSGMQPHEVADILGHASVNLVLNLYGHVMPGRKRQAADIMGSILHGPADGEKEQTR